jgi:hypothetical protein
MGLTVLVNDTVEIVRGTSRFWLAGTGDPAGVGSPPGGRSDVAPDIARTLARVPLRIGALPEVTVLTLRRAEGGEAEIGLPSPDQR